MNEKIYHYFEEILSNYPMAGNVLEIGATPTNDSLLFSPILKSAALKVGVNIDGGQSMTALSPKIDEPGIKIFTANANDMSFFKDGKFHVVLSNATLEHDKYFWKTIREMKRVLAIGGLMIIGVPGYVREITHEGHPLVTFTHRVHDWPGDFYRFSEQACREVFFADFEIIAQTVIIIGKTPKIITSGIKLK